MDNIVDVNLNDYTMYVDYSANLTWISFHNESNTFRFSSVSEELIGKYVVTIVLVDEPWGL